MNTLLEYATTRGWALNREHFDHLLGVLRRHAEGQRMSKEEVEEIVAARDAGRRSDVPERMVVEGGVARIPVQGVIAPKASMVGGISQPRGTSAEEISRNLRTALRDPNVRTILLEIDSPGGSADGLPELADEIHAARGEKPVMAFTDRLAASAAYWIASQAETFLATKSARVGSIGVYSVFLDDSVRLHNEGLKVEVIKAGEFKAMGAGGSLSARDKSVLQSEIDTIYGMFVDAVARGRGLSSEDALALADGRVHFGAQAKTAGLIDDVTTVGAILRKAKSLGRNAASVSAALSTYDDDDTVSAGHTGEAPGKDCDMTEQVKTITAEAFASEHPDVAQALRDQGAAKARDEATKAAGEAERKRATAILAKAAPEQMALAKELVESGASVEEAYGKLLDDHQAHQAERVEAARKEGEAKARVSDLRESAPKPIGNAGDGDANAKGSPTLEDRWAAMSESERLDYADDFEIFKAEVAESAAA